MFDSKDQEDYRKILSESKMVCEYIKSLPITDTSKEILINAHLKIVYDLTCKQTQILNRIISNVKDTFSDAMLDFKYMAFDLQSTKQEKEQLDRRLKELEN